MMSEFAWEECFMISNMKQNIIGWMIKWNDSTYKLNDTCHVQVRCYHIWYITCLMVNVQYAILCVSFWKDEHRKHWRLTVTEPAARSGSCWIGCREKQSAQYPGGDHGQSILCSKMAILFQMWTTPRSWLPLSSSRFPIWIWISAKHGIRQIGGATVLEKCEFISILYILICRTYFFSITSIHK